MTSNAGYGDFIIIVSVYLAEENAAEGSRSLLKPGFIHKKFPVTVALLEQESEPPPNTAWPSQFTKFKEETTEIKPGVFHYPMDIPNRYIHPMDISTPSGTSQMKREELPSTSYTQYTSSGDKNRSHEINICKKKRAHSLSKKLSPIEVTRTHRPPPETVCPIIQRRGNINQLPYYPPENLDYTRRQMPEKGMAKSIEEVHKYIPVLSYPSTVVTMTNNMATIRKHREVTGSCQAENPETKIYDLINNVLKGEKQITSVFASVTDPGDEQSCMSSCDGSFVSNGDRCGNNVSSGELLNTSSAMFDQR